MDKGIVTEAELLDAAVEHIHKSSVGRQDLAHWPNHGQDIERGCLEHAIPDSQGVHCCANGQI